MTITLIQWLTDPRVVQDVAVVPVVVYEFMNTASKVEYGVFLLKN